MHGLFHLSLNGSGAMIAAGVSRRAQQELMGVLGRALQVT